MFARDQRPSLFVLTVCDEVKQSFIKSPSELFDSGNDGAPGGGDERRPEGHRGQPQPDGAGFDPLPEVGVARQAHLCAGEERRTRP